MYNKQDYEIKKIEPNTKYVNVIDTDLLLSLFNCQTHTRDKIAQNKFLKDIIGQFIKNNNINCVVEKDKYGNMYITKGKAKVYPCVVSHIDTVHKYDKDFKAFKCDDLVIGLSKGEQCGLGADPKNGVYILMELLLLTDNIKCVLFLDEECGCCGSAKSDIDFFKDCAFVMQFDRNSFNNDVIEHTNGIQVLSQSFKDKLLPIMKEFQYDFNYGTCTDVGELTQRDVNINTFNVSNGSFNEHMDCEVASIPHILNALNFGIEVVNTLGSKRELFYKQVVVKKDKWTNTWTNRSWEEWDGDVQELATFDTTYVENLDYDKYGINEGEWIEATKSMVDDIEDATCSFCDMKEVVEQYSVDEAYCQHCGISYYIPEVLQKPKKIHSASLK